MAEGLTLRLSLPAVGAVLTHRRRPTDLTPPARPWYNK